MSIYKFYVGGRVDGRVGDYNATCVAPTDQLRLGLVEVSWSAGARCGNMISGKVMLNLIWNLTFISTALSNQLVFVNEWLFIAKLSSKHSN